MIETILGLAIMFLGFGALLLGRHVDRLENRIHDLELAVDNLKSDQRRRA